MWKIYVRNQSIEVREKEILADQQIQYVQFRFTFEGDWKRFHKVVHFSQGDETYSIVLGIDSTSCFLPAELHAGVAKMAVFGYDTESDTTVRATTVPITLNIRESGFEGEEPPIPPTPDLYTQLLKRIEDAEHGIDGKSAYDIAVEHGYIGTEEEWLSSLHGKDGVTPDMSDYPKTTEVTEIVEHELETATGDFHIHANKETLDRLTPELMQELDGLQQFEDSITYDIQTLNEAVENFRPSTHSHTNLDVLNTLTEALIADLQGLQQFEDATNYDIQDIREAVNSLTSAVHSHNNKAVLDNITQEMMDDMQGWQNAITEIANRVTVLEQTLFGIENALADIVEVTT